MLNGARPNQWLDVDDIDFSIHQKNPRFNPDALPTLRVDYFCGPVRYSEWHCFEHQGYAREKAVKWWDRMKAIDPPSTVDEAWNRASDGELARPSAILVRKEGKFDRIVAHRFEKIPVSADRVKNAFIGK
jgi:DNA repair protein RadD